MNSTQISILKRVAELNIHTYPWKTTLINNIIKDSKQCLADMNDQMTSARIEELEWAFSIAEPYGGYIAKQIRQRLEQLKAGGGK